MTNVPVCIIGCGPIGLAAALLLAKFDIPSLILEKRSEVNTHPRSRFVDTNTMELMRFLGIEKEIENTGLGPDWTAFNRWAVALNKDPIAAISSPTFHSVPRDTSPSLPVMTCQDYVEDVLLSQLHGNKLIEVKYRSEVTSLTQDDKSTTVVFKDLESGEHSTVQAEYTIGSDGPHSFARTAISSNLEAEPRPYLMQDVIFEADLAEYVGDRKGGLLYTLTPGGVLIFQPLNGKTRWRCQIPRMDGTQLDEEQTVAFIRQAAGAEDKPPVSIVSTGMWQPTPGCVDVMSKGRIFLAGDAAHISVPTGGMGNNIGFAGARNLAWKLAFVLKGWAPAAILQTYAIEHRPFALQRIDVGVKTTDYMGGIFAAHYAGGDVDPAVKLTQQYADYDGVLLGFELHSCLVADNPEAPPLVADPTMDFVPCIRAGRRAPHIWADQQQDQSVLDWFGLGYVLLAAADVAADRWAAAVEDLADTGYPIKLRVLPAGDVAPYQPYQPSQLVLVRPDGIIADYWQDNRIDDGEVSSRLANVLPLI